MARRLRGRTVPARRRIVGLALPRGIDMVVALFAVLRAGAAYLPLDLDYAGRAAADMIEDARRCSHVVLELAGTGSTTEVGEPWLADFAPGTPGRLDRPAYVIYTSGSTGRPKGVVTPYRGLTNMQLNHREAIFAPTVAAAADRVLTIAHTVSFSFDMSWEELLWLVEGHQVHVADEELRRDGRALVAYCAAHRVDVVNVTPTYAQAAARTGPARRTDLPPGLVLLGGEAVPEKLWSVCRHRGRRRLQPLRPNRIHHQHIGWRHRRQRHRDRRPAHPQHPRVRPRPPAAAGAAGRRGRAVHRRYRPGARLPATVRR